MNSVVVSLRSIVEAVSAGPVSPCYFRGLVITANYSIIAQGMVIGCWLVESGIARDGDEALRMISKEWQTVEKCRRFPHSPETGPQLEFVRSYKRLGR